MIEVGRWLIFDFFHYPNPEQKPSVWIWKRMYSVIGLSKEEVEGLRSSFEQQKGYIVSESQTIVDQFLAENYQKMKVQVRLGIENPENYDMFVVGNHICKIYFEKAHDLRWKAV